MSLAGTDKGGDTEIEAATAVTECRIGLNSPARERFPSLNPHSAPGPLLMMVPCGTYSSGVCGGQGDLSLAFDDRPLVVDREDARLAPRFFFPLIVRCSSQGVFLLRSQAVLSLRYFSPNWGKVSGRSNSKEGLFALAHGLGGYSPSRQRRQSTFNGIRGCGGGNTRLLGYIPGSREPMRKMIPRVSKEVPFLYMIPGILNVGVFSTFHLCCKYQNHWGTDDSMTLQSQKFQIGDYLDIAITPPNRAPPSSGRMRPY
ncbi:mCG140775 [Mus musculus]|nr:mCG140775 [Mus musculus]